MFVATLNYSPFHRVEILCAAESPGASSQELKDSAGRVDYFSKTNHTEHQISFIAIKLNLLCKA